MISIRGNMLSIEIYRNNNVYFIICKVNNKK